MTEIVAALCVAMIPLMSEGIRLLTIHPRKDDSDRLMCSLDTVRLEEATKYTAVSYCWGQSTARRVIELNNQLVEINQNLHQILERLSKRNTGPFWIDSLCIDQSNLEEKSRQVQLLHRIYQSAQSTLVVLDQIDKPVEELVFAVKTYSRESSYYKTWREEEAALHKFNLLSSPWFSRVWTLQELLLSKEIILIHDSRELDWNGFWADILPLSHSLQYFPSSSLDSFERGLRINLIIRRLKNWRHTSSHEPALHQLRSILEYQSVLECSDPRDKVFSLFGALRLFDIYLPPPDYSKSIVQVFKETIANMLATTTGLENIGVFDEIRRVTHHVPWLPKWQADLCNHQLRDPFFEGLVTMRKFRDSSSFMRKDAKYDYDATHLDVELTILAASGAKDAFYVFFDQQIGRLKELLSRDVESFSNSLFISSVYTDGDDRSRTGPGSDGTSTMSRQNIRGNAGATSSNAKAINVRKRLVEEEGDEGNLERRPSKYLKDHVDIWDRLACPYFQRNSQGPRILGSCRGLGFENLSRLKEHLYRDHLIYPCDRCGAIFRKKDDLTKHVRQSVPCAVTDWKLAFDRAQGFDDEQEKDIRRKTIRTWQAIFKILFPEDAEDTYPPQHHHNPQFVQLFDQFQAHYLTEIERLIPERLINNPAIVMLSLEEQYSVQLALSNITNDIHREVVASFRNNVLRAARETELPSPNRLFLDYLGHVAPEGVLTDTLATAVETDLDFSSFLGNSRNHAEESWHMVDGE